MRSLCVQGQSTSRRRPAAADSSSLPTLLTATWRRQTVCFWEQVLGMVGWGSGGARTKGRFSHLCPREPQHSLIVGQHKAVSHAGLSLSPPPPPVSSLLSCSTSSRMWEPCSMG